MVLLGLTKDCLPSPPITPSAFFHFTYLVPFILVLTPVIYTFLVASPSSFSSSSPLLPLSIALSWSVLLLPLFVLPPITIVSPLSSSSFFSLTSFHFFFFSVSSFSSFSSSTPSALPTNSFYFNSTMNLSFPPSRSSHRARNRPLICP